MRWLPKYSMHLDLSAKMQNQTSLIKSVINLRYLETHSLVVCKFIKLFNKYLWSLSLARQHVNIYRIMFPL